MQPRAGLFCFALLGCTLCTLPGDVFGAEDLALESMGGVFAHAGPVAQPFDLRWFPTNSVGLDRYSEAARAFDHP